MKVPAYLAARAWIIKSYLLNFFFSWSNGTSRTITVSNLSQFKNSLAPANDIIFIYDVMVADR